MNYETNVYIRHWIDRNCLPWSKNYFDENILNTVVEKDNYVFVLNKVNSVNGDCDVTQRKGKVLCIYDMQLEFSVNVEKNNSDEEDNKITAKITIPEFVHDQEEDEYVFEIDSNDYKSEIRKFFIPALKSRLMNFQGDLIKAHEKDVQHSS